MKRTLSILSAALLATALAVPAFAATKHKTEKPTAKHSHVVKHSSTASKKHSTKSTKTSSKTAKKTEKTAKK